MIKIAIENDPDKRRLLYKYMLDEIMGSLVPIRPGRSFKRKHYKGGESNYNSNNRRNC